jgi:soluble cytochrome b562
MKTKKEIKKLAEKYYHGYIGNMDMCHEEEDRKNFIYGYTLAQNDMKKYKKGFDLLYDFIDDLSEEWAAENPKLVKQLDKIGL